MSCSQTGRTPSNNKHRKYMIAYTYDCVNDMQPGRQNHSNNKYRLMKYTIASI